MRIVLGGGFGSVATVRHIERVLDIEVALRLTGLVAWDAEHGVTSTRTTIVRGTVKETPRIPLHRGES